MNVYKHVPLVANRSSLSLSLSLSFSLSLKVRTIPTTRPTSPACKLERHFFGNCPQLFQLPMDRQGRVTVLDISPHWVTFYVIVLFFSTWTPLCSLLLLELFFGYYLLVDNLYVRPCSVSLTQRCPLCCRGKFTIQPRPWICSCSLACSQPTVLQSKTWTNWVPI